MQDGLFTLALSVFDARELRGLIHRSTAGHIPESTLLRVIDGARWIIRRRDDLDNPPLIRLWMPYYESQWEEGPWPFGLGRKPCDPARLDRWHGWAGVAFTPEPHELLRPIRYHRGAAELLAPEPVLLHMVRCTRDECRAWRPEPLAGWGKLLYRGPRRKRLLNRRRAWCAGPRQVSPQGLTFPRVFRTRLGESWARLLFDDGDGPDFRPNSPWTHALIWDDCPSAHCRARFVRHADLTCHKGAWGAPDPYCVDCGMELDWEAWHWVPNYDGRKPAFYVGPEPCCRSSAVDPLSVGPDAEPHAEPQLVEAPVESRDKWDAHDTDTEVPDYDADGAYVREVYAQGVYVRSTGGNSRDFKGWDGKTPLKKCAKAIHNLHSRLVQDGTKRLQDEIAYFVATDRLAEDEPGPEHRGNPDARKDFRKWLRQRVRSPRGRAEKSTVSQT